MHTHPMVGGGVVFPSCGGVARSAGVVLVIFEHPR